MIKERVFMRTRGHTHTQSCFMGHLKPI